MAGFLRRTILGGLFVLAPILGALFLLANFVRAIQKILMPLAEHIPGTAGLIAKEGMAIVLAALLCFLLGLAVETGIGRSLRGYMERSFLMKLPGYSFFKRLVENFAGIEKEFAQPVLIQFDDSAQFGFLIDEGEQSTVFIPSSPTVANGAVMVVANRRLRKLDAGAQQVVQSLTKWGFESQQFLAASKSPQG